jgi:hypothetical protein
MKGRLLHDGNSKCCESFLIPCAAGHTEVRRVVFAKRHLVPSAHVEAVKEHHNWSPCVLAHVDVFDFPYKQKRGPHKSQQTEEMML